MNFVMEPGITDEEWIDALDINSDRDVTDYRGVCETVLAAKTAWIRVAEKLPEMGARVLGTFKGQFGWVIFPITHTLGGFVNPAYAEPTHWQPLPAPPPQADKEEK